MPEFPSCRFFIAIQRYLIAMVSAMVRCDCERTWLRAYFDSCFGAAAAAAWWELTRMEYSVIGNRGKHNLC
jgi:hypothetical protein